MRTEEELLKRYYNSKEYLRKGCDPLFRIIENDINDAERLLTHALVERSEKKSLSEYYTSTLKYLSKQRLKRLDILESHIDTENKELEEKNNENRRDSKNNS